MDADWDRLRAGAFWRWLFKGEASFEDERSFTLELIIASGDGLNVEVAEGTSVTLVDRREGTELGWLDDSHFHPSCLRADEVLSLASSQTDPARRHLATLLLLPFAVVTSDPDAAVLQTAAQQAWEAAGFEGTCPGLQLAEFPEAHVEWHLDDRRRWCLRQVSDDLSVRPLYSVRVEENPDFPAWLSELGR